MLCRSVILAPMAVAIDELMTNSLTDSIGFMIIIKYLGSIMWGEGRAI
jgi:hypothetical protein